MKSTNAPKIPTKWLVVLVFVLVAYGLGQPLANRKLGWSLPSLASLLGQEQAESKSRSVGTSAPGRQSVAEEEVADPIQEPSAESDALDAASDAIVAANKIDVAANSPGKLDTDLGSSKPSSSSSDSSLKYGLLRDLGREDFVSPAGLHYTRGSEEGHRLKHIERHLADQPDRPGKHGVFDGDMPQVLRWLDDAYTRAKSGAKGTSKHEEDGRTVYEVAFSKPIGFIGGRDGKRQGNPDAKRLRMVVDGNRVITAFPY